MAEVGPAWGDVRGAGPLRRFVSHVAREARFTMGVSGTTRMRGPPSTTASETGR